MKLAQAKEFNQNLWAGSKFEEIKFEEVKKYMEDNGYEIKKITQ